MRRRRVACCGVMEATADANVLTQRTLNPSGNLKLSRASTGVNGRETNRSLPQTQPLTPVLRPRSIPGVLENLVSPWEDYVVTVNGFIGSNELPRIGPVELTDYAHIAT